MAFINGQRQFFLRHIFKHITFLMAPVSFEMLIRGSLRKIARGRRKLFLCALVGLFEPPDLLVDKLLETLNCGVSLPDDALQILALLLHDAQLLFKPIS